MPLACLGGFAAYAEALGQKEDAAKLKGIVKEIYKADDYSSHLAQQAEKAAARA
jgi:hypothetical protein